MRRVPVRLTDHGNGDAAIGRVGVPETILPDIGEITVVIKRIAAAVDYQR